MNQKIAQECLARINHSTLATLRRENHGQSRLNQANRTKHNPKESRPTIQPDGSTSPGVQIAIAQKHPHGIIGLNRKIGVPDIRARVQFGKRSIIFLFTAFDDDGPVRDQFGKMQVLLG